MQFRYRYDSETGLYYLNSRYYNPDWGRFINADALVGEVGELLSHNMFAYCGNDPVNMEDPSGYLGIKKTQDTLLGVGLLIALKMKQASDRTISTINNVAAKILNKGADKTNNILSPLYKNVELGRGSTGRKIANNLKEQLAMKQVLSDPLRGAKWREEIVMSDTTHGWLAKDGWIKMSNNVNGVEIHFFYNKVTEVFDDFKFK